MRNILLCLPLLLLCFAPAFARDLEASDARLLVENAPDYLKAVKRSHCPRTELLWVERTTAAFQVRSHCPAGATGLIGNYFVDLKTGIIYRSIDGDQLVDSRRLRKLRKKLLATAPKTSSS